MSETTLSGRIVLKDRIIEGRILIENDAIKRIDETGNINCKDYILPGFVDLHTHGSGGFDFMDGTEDDIVKAAASHAKFGTTTCLPTTLTCSDDDLFLFLKNLKSVRNKQISGSINGIAKMPGTHLEGPYFDMVEKGAQDPRYIQNPNPEHYNRILEEAEGLIKRWSVAPELPGAMQFIDTIAKEGILVSAGHTAATYDIVSEAYDHGIRLLTHFYSGMSSIVRKGGFRVLGTVESGYLIDGLNLELICDGKHLPPELLKMIFKMKDNDRIIACSDSMRGAGMPNGPSILGPKNNGTDCIIEDGIAKMPDRTCFAGSVATGIMLAKTLNKTMGFDLPKVSRILSLQPAELIGMERSIGSIETGKKADLVICNDDLVINKVLIDGVEIA